MSVTPSTSTSTSTSPKKSLASQIPSTGNKVLDELLHIMIRRFEHLVERGFLAPHFLNKMISDPNEILKFLRQNRAVVGDQLNRRLDPSIRPTPKQLEQKGIVPVGYFTNPAGYKQAIKKRHRRRSTAGQDLAMMIKLRPKPEDIIQKGIMDKDDAEHYYNVDDTKLIDILTETDDFEAIEINIINNGPYEISILSTLLFKTIKEALKKSCIDTQNEETAVLAEMEEMNNEMKSLRSVLDKYFLSDNNGSINPDLSNIAKFQAEEDLVRNKFHGIQEKLLRISVKQNRIHQKLTILHSVEKSMIELQNLYNQQLYKLKISEENILNELNQQKKRRNKAIKIMIAEKSHQDWANAKLDYTISLAKNDFNDKNDNSNKFVDDLDKFLCDLKKISLHQKQIVLDFDECIKEFEMKLMSIRHDMSKVRTMTFKKIYDLHKQVQIAETLDLGINRRLSVASATEIERERRHNYTKIQRQLTTLTNCIRIQTKNGSIRIYEKNLNEIIDVQHIMSDNKLKSFFSVFIQCFNQTICDIELMYRNISSNLNQNKIYNGTTTNDHYIKINNLCKSLYGIQNVINKIKLNNNKSSNNTNKLISLKIKLKKCMNFIFQLKNSIRNEYNIRKVGTYRLNLIVVIIARKLCIHEFIYEEIERTHIQQIPRFAEIRSKDIFEVIINSDKNNKIFQKINKKNHIKYPKNTLNAARLILLKVFGIKDDDDNNNLQIS